MKKLLLLFILTGTFTTLIGCKTFSNASDYINDAFEWSENELPSAIEDFFDDVTGSTNGAETEQETTKTPFVAEGEIQTTDLTEPEVLQMGVVTDVSLVVEKVMPSIVSVSNFYSETFSFFGRQIENEGEASGSGIIIGQNEDELLIATNYHVVHGATMLTIEFIDGSIALAQLKGGQPNMDLAVVAVLLEELEKETLENIAIATLGDSDTLRVGEPAIAIGNAMGYGQSVTTGIVSALEREMSYYVGEIGNDVYQIDGKFIQTDAAINPGNSGGALLNIKGEVIGINSSKLGGERIEGMGYAIPISAAKPIIAELMSRETRVKVAEEEKGYIGITGTSVSNEISELLGLPKGVYITGVFPGTPADRANLSEGDIILKFDGIEILGWDDLVRRLDYYRAGDRVELLILSGDAVHGYEEKTIRLTLGQREVD